MKYSVIEYVRPHGRQRLYTAEFEETPLLKQRLADLQEVGAHCAFECIRGGEYALYITGSVFDYAIEIIQVDSIEDLHKQLQAEFSRMIQKFDKVQFIAQQLKEE